MGFLQADPIRAPARAQDLILRPRVKGYRAGDLERRYGSLGIEEDFFVNYGFVTRAIEALMHPRPHPRASAKQRQREELLLDFVAQRGVVHPREVEAHFEHGSVQNYWGGTSHATTHMLDALHYRGLLRIDRREKGIRLYRVQPSQPTTMTAMAARERLDALVDVVVNLYAPLPAVSLSYYVRRLRYAVPQWQPQISGALSRARERLAQVSVEGIDWYWPNEESPLTAATPSGVRLLAPFDPVVHDRKRFQLLWGWVYRFEAYTPVAKRLRGYYALPLLWRDRVIGWANLALVEGSLTANLGYQAEKPPADGTFRAELAAELERMRAFLGAAQDL